MIGLKKKKGMREELSSMLVSALTPSNGSGNGTPETKGKPALAGARAVATGAALYATGRGLVSGLNKLNKLNEPSAPDEEEDPEPEEDRDPEPEEHEDDEEDERDGRPRLRTRVRCLERD